MTKRNPADVLALSEARIHDSDKTGAKQMTSNPVEREAVVAWLRKKYASWSPTLDTDRKDIGQWLVLKDIANAIEEGQHLQEQSNDK